MCERLKQTVLKTVIPERVSGVRIPLPPPETLGSYDSLRSVRISAGGSDARHTPNLKTVMPERYRGSPGDCCNSKDLRPTRHNNFDRAERFSFSKHANNASPGRSELR